MAKQLQEVQIPPGFVDGTAREIKQRWLKGNLVRFRDGRLRPIGGWSTFPLSRHSETLDSAVRGHHMWRSNSNVGLFVLATAGSGNPNYGKLYAAEIVSAASFTDSTASTTEDSNQITVTDATDFEVGDTITGSGIPPGTVVDSISSNTITLNNNCTATASPVTVTVNQTQAYQRFYDITPAGYQASGDSEYRPGYGYYYYGDGVFGYSYTGPGSVSFSRTAHWSFDNFGENLVFTHSGDKAIGYWTGDPTVAAEEITTANGYTETAPTAVGVLVTQERHVLALGADTDARLVRWSSQETVDEWTASATNTAGSLPLQTEGYIVAARRVPQGVAIWTDQDVHLLQYLGPPLVYGINKLADNAGVYSPYAIHSSSEITCWLNRGGFWVMDGLAKPLPCPIQDRVLRTVDWSQEGLIYSGGNAEFGEVWWWCPSTSGTDGECEYYVIYNYRDNVWYDSLAESGVSRNCWIDKGIWPAPIAVDAGDNTIYQHESTDPAQTENAEAETGAIDLMRGERYSRISKIFSDSDQQTAGSINFQFYTASSGDAAETTSSSYPLESDGEIDVRLQGRQVRYRVTGTLTQDWTVGNTRFETHVGGRR